MGGDFVGGALFSFFGIGGVIATWYGLFNADNRMAFGAGVVLGCAAIVVIGMLARASTP